MEMNIQRYYINKWGCVRYCNPFKYRFIFKMSDWYFV